MRSEISSTALRALLDDQHRRAGRGELADVLAEHGVRDRGREVRGRLVEHDERGLEHQRAPHREHLALAAAQLAGPAASIAPSCGKTLEHVLDPAGDLARAQQVAAHLQVLAHGQRREDVVDLRHVADADPRDLLGRPAGDVAVADEDAARRGPRRCRRAPSAGCSCPSRSGRRSRRPRPARPRPRRRGAPGCRRSRRQLDRAQRRRPRRAVAARLSRQGRPRRPRCVRRSVRHRALGEHRALGHDDHRVAELVHDRQLVLDHDHRHARLAQRDELHADLVGQPRVHARPSARRAAARRARPSARA